MCKLRFSLFAAVICIAGIVGFVSVTQAATTPSWEQVSKQKNEIYALIEQKFCVEARRKMILYRLDQLLHPLAYLVRMRVHRCFKEYEEAEVQLREFLRSTQNDPRRKVIRIRRRYKEELRTIVDLLNFRSNLEQVKRSHKKIYNKYRSLKYKIRRLRRRQQGLKEQIESGSRNRRQLEQRLRELEQELERSERLFEKRRKELQRFKDKYHKLQKKLNELRKEFRSALRDYAGQLRELEQKNHDLQRDNKDLLEVVSRLRKEIEDWKKYLRSRKVHLMFGVRGGWSLNPAMQNPRLLFTTTPIHALFQVHDYFEISLGIELHKELVTNLQGVYLERLLPELTAGARLMFLGAGYRGFNFFMGGSSGLGVVVPIPRHPMSLYVPVMGEIGIQYRPSPTKRQAGFRIAIQAGWRFPLQHYAPGGFIAGLSLAWVVIP